MHRPLSVLLVAAGIGHAVSPAFFDAIVPRWLPGSARTWTLVSGAAEAAVGIAVAVPRTRRAGAYAAAALFVAVFPANVQMAVDRSDRTPREKAIAYGRLPLQVPLVLWALRTARR